MGERGEREGKRVECLWPSKKGQRKRVGPALLAVLPELKLKGCVVHQTRSRKPSKRGCACITLSQHLRPVVRLWPEKNSDMSRRTEHVHSEFEVPRACSLHLADALFGGSQTLTSGLTGSFAWFS